MAVIDEARSSAFSALLILIIIIPGFSPSGTSSGDHDHSGQRAVAPHGPDTLWVSSNETWQERRVSTNGALFVTNNATLTLEGSVIRLNGSLTIFPGSKVVARAFNGHPTEILPRTIDATLEVLAVGALVSEGQDSLNITFLSGNGYGSFFGWGGLFVAGSADLQGVAVEGGRAGVMVDEGAKLRMRDSRIVNNGPVGLMPKGEAEFENVTVLGHGVGLSTNGSPGVRINDSRFFSYGTNLFCANAFLWVSNSTLTGGDTNGISCEGNSRLVVDRTSIAGYQRWGLLANNIDSGRPKVVVKDVLLDGRGTAMAGIYFLAAKYATVEGAVILNHKENGISSVSTNLTVWNSTIQRNGRYGVQAAEGPYHEYNNDYGSTPSEQNAAGAVEAYGFLQVHLRDPQGRVLVGAEVKVNSAKNGTTMAVTRVKDDGQQVTFPLWKRTNDGQILASPPYYLTASGAGYETTNVSLQQYYGPLTVTMTPETDGHVAFVIGASAFALLSMATALLVVRRRGARRKD